MQIILNGREEDIADGLTAGELIEGLGLGGRRIAIEVNREVVVRSTFSTHVLQAGDHVEIIHAIGGG
ncbi:MAG: sulfur carrier protein ThiS [Gammaproteobacteria bacterium]|nr:sulfur carrier protein ThiS [Gammaproteobacteria bacterium]